MPDKDWKKKNRERVRAYDREYYARTRDERRRQNRLRMAKKREEDRDAYNAQVQAWRLTNPELNRLNNRRGGAKRRARTKGTLEGYDVIVDKDPCAYCGQPGTVLDHIVPLARSGIHEWENITAACRACNGRKHAKSLLMFLLEQVT